MGAAFGSRTAHHGVRSLNARAPLAGDAASRRVALALDALRHGWPVMVDGVLCLLPAETGFAPSARAQRMLISSARAVTLKLANQREAAVPEAPVLIRAAQPFDLDLARAVADPALDLQYPMKGPFAADHLEDGEAARTAMELARLAGVLPAFLVDPAPVGEGQAVSSSDLTGWKDSAHLAIATRARLPVAACEDTEIVAFRSADDLREHVALVVGRQDGARAPLVRLHSECLTGDILGSLKCDCGPQLHAALHAMADEARDGGWGVLLYLRQEGRGIGLINKLRAYELQDQGFDTVEANHRLGFEDDERDFRIGADLLRRMGFSKVRLLTNNPRKVDMLSACGLTVIERVPLKVGQTSENAAYLATKAAKSGHLL